MEAREDRRRAVQELVESWAWREAVRPALKARLQRLERSLAGARTKSIEELRLLQGEHAAWARLVENPLETLLAGE